MLSRSGRCSLPDKPRRSQRAQAVLQRALGLTRECVARPRRDYEIVKQDGFAATVHGHRIRPHLRHVALNDRAMPTMVKQHTRNEKATSNSEIRQSANLKVPR